MKIIGLKSFVAFLKVNVTQVHNEIRDCHIPDQYHQVYYKIIGIKQSLENLKGAITDDRTKEYINSELDNLKVWESYCKSRF